MRSIPEARTARPEGPITPFVLAPDVTHSGIALAHDGNSFLAVWTSHDGALAARHVSANGTPSEVFPIAYGERGWDPALAWNGPSFLLAWVASAMNPECRITCAPDSQIRALALGADGQRKPGAETRELGFTQSPSLAWTGTHFALFADGTWAPMRAWLLSSDGDLVGDPVTLPIRGQHTAAAWTGDSLLLLWQNTRGIPYRMNLSRALAPLRRPVVLADAGVVPGGSSLLNTVAVAPDASVIVHPRRLVGSQSLAIPELVIDDARETARRRVLAR